MPSSMLCPKCGNGIAEGVSCCDSCGAALSEPGEETLPLPPSLSPEPVSAFGGGSFGVASPAPALSLADLKPPFDFGPRYHVEAVLGEGGMGKVYKAFDRELDRTVALKVVRSDYASNPDAMRRFKRELLLASTISHRNVLRIHDMGSVGGLKFITMAYVEGPDLQRLMAQSGILPPERIIKLAKQLCAALEAAHEVGVVHRDLKPQNILIDGNDHVYVTDFGLAKPLEVESSMLTQTGQLLGTPRYMSPEQVEGRPVDHRSDIYSLGLILYEMATGETPFPGESVMQMMFLRVNGAAPDLKLRRPDLPDYLAQIIMRCLERDPERRYQSARDILAELEAVRLPGALTTGRARPDSVMKQRRWKVLVPCGTVLLVAAGLAIPPVRQAVFGPELPASPGAALEKHMALLPLSTSGDESAKYVADGLVETLSAKLSGFRGLYVASPEAVDGAIKNGADSPEKIAKALGVTLVLEGHFESMGDRLKVAIELRDLRKDRSLWNQELPGERQDLLGIEDQIYTKIIAALDLRASSDELSRAASKPTADTNAYDLYLRARTILRGQRDTKSFNAALNLYEQALRQDPGFALAYAGVANVCLGMYQLTSDTSWIGRAEGAANQAVHLNDNLPEVHLALGRVYSVTGRSPEAISETRRALELAPNSDDGYRRLADAYRMAGRRDEAIQAGLRAVKINPYYWSNYLTVGRIYFQYGLYDKAFEALRKVTELEPNVYNGWISLGAVYLGQGKWQESIEAFQRALKLKPEALPYSNMGVAYFYLGNYAQSAGMFEKAVAMNPNNYTIYGNLADAYRWLGERDKAEADYQRAISLAYKAYQINPRDAATLGNMATYYAKAGDTKRALEFIRQARSIDKDNSNLIYQEATIFALTGKQSEALEDLREAFKRGYSREQAKNDPELRSLRVFPQFERLLAESSRK